MGVSAFEEAMQKVSGTNLVAILTPDQSTETREKLVSICPKTGIGSIAATPARALELIHRQRIGLQWRLSLFDSNFPIL